MIAHECKIAGRDNFLRLKFNASLTISHSECASVTFLQTRERVGQIPCVQSGYRWIVWRERATEITGVVGISPAHQRSPDLGRTAGNCVGRNVRERDITRLLHRAI